VLYLPFSSGVSVLYNPPANGKQGPIPEEMSQDAGIEPRTVATLALTARRSNHSLSKHNYCAVIYTEENTVPLSQIHTLPRFCPLIYNIHTEPNTDKLRL
jgi:hypothetical protein